MRSKRSRRWLTCVGLLLMLAGVASAQEIYLLLPPHDARARGLGLAAVASIDMPGSITLNPAAIAAVAGPTVVALVHTPQYADYVATMAFALPAGGLGSFAGSVAYGNTEVQDWTRANGSVAGELRLGPYLMIGAGWGYPIDEAAAIGVRARWISSKWSTEPPGTDGNGEFNGSTFVFDAGIHSRLSGLSGILGMGDSAIAIGLEVANVGSDIHYSDNGVSFYNPLPTSATFGFVVLPFEAHPLKFSVSADLRYLLRESFLTREGRVQYGSGIELEILGRYMLRTGITTLDPGEFGFDLRITAGAGLRIGDYDFSIAYSGQRFDSSAGRFDLSIGARFPSGDAR